MSATHRRAMPNQARAKFGLLTIAPDAVRVGRREAGRRRDRRRVGLLQGIGARIRHRSATLELCLAQERQRVAAEIHDLVMQDVSFALARARAIASDPALAADHAEAAVLAGERALAGARTIVGGLAEHDRRPIAEAFEESVRLAAREAPLRVELAIPAGAHADQETYRALVHIGREGVTNAVKHSNPTCIAVSLSHDDEWRLRISDDGRGFDPGRIQAGFGLDSIYRQAQELGGSLSVSSAIGHGTVVEVSLP